MRSFLGGNTTVHFGLNSDLVIGREEGMVHGIGSVVLQDCSFHEKANLSEFDKDRAISIAAQDGEFTVMKYRVASDISNSLPFRIFTTVEDGQIARSLRVLVRVKCDIPSKSSGTNVIVRIPVPKGTIR
jgi:AP-4 complex subunit mu-1